MGHVSATHTLRCGVCEAKFIGCRNIRTCLPGKKRKYEKIVVPLDFKSVKLLRAIMADLIFCLVHDVKEFVFAFPEAAVAGLHRIIKKKDFK